jgi:peptidase A4-like protein
MRIARSGRLRAGVLAACLLAPVGLVPAGSAAAATIGHPGPKHLVTPPGRLTSSSTNWAGFATFHRRTTFSKVRGRWVQPIATCNTNNTQYASFWIGLDGYNSNTVEQIGTDSDCVGHTPTYYAWFEMFPAVPHNVPVAIHPGDQIVTRISASNHRFTLVLANATTGKSFHTRERLDTAQQASAEWIAEAPSSCRSTCHVLPLANFGSVDFTGSYTTGNGHEGSISDARWNHDRIAMVSQDRTTVKAATSQLNSTGTEFSVIWQHV